MRGLNQSANFENNQFITKLITALTSGRSYDPVLNNFISLIPRIAGVAGLIPDPRVTDAALRLASRQGIGMQAENFFQYADGGRARHQAEIFYAAHNARMTKMYNERGGYALALDRGNTAMVAYTLQRLGITDSQRQIQKVYGIDDTVKQLQDRVMLRNIANKNAGEGTAVSLTDSSEDARIKEQIIKKFGTYYDGSAAARVIHGDTMGDTEIEQLKRLLRSKGMSEEDINAKIAEVKNVDTINAYKDRKDATLNSEDSRAMKDLISVEKELTRKLEKLTQPGADVFGNMEEITKTEEQLRLNRLRQVQIREDYAGEGAVAQRRVDAARRHGMEISGIGKELFNMDVSESLQVATTLSSSLSDMKIIKEEFKDYINGMLEAGLEMGEAQQKMRRDLASVQALQQQGISRNVAANIVRRASIGIALANQASGGLGGYANWDRAEGRIVKATSANILNDSRRLAQASAIGLADISKEGREKLLAEIAKGGSISEKTLKDILSPEDFSKFMDQFDRSSRRIRENGAEDVMEYMSSDTITALTKGSLKESVDQTLKNMEGKAPPELLKKARDFYEGKIKTLTTEEKQEMLSHGIAIDSIEGARDQAKVTDYLQALGGKARINESVVGSAILRDSLLSSEFSKGAKTLTDKELLAKAGLNNNEEGRKALKTLMGKDNMSLDIGDKTYIKTKDGEWKEFKKEDVQKVKESKEVSDKETMKQIEEGKVTDQDRIVEVYLRSMVKSLETIAVNTTESPGFFSFNVKKQG